MENPDNKCKMPICEANKYENSLYCYECNHRVVKIMKSIDEYQHKIADLVDKLTVEYDIKFQDGELDEE